MSNTEQMTRCPECGGIVAYDSYYRAVCCTSVFCTYRSTQSSQAPQEGRVMSNTAWIVLKGHYDYKDEKSVVDCVVSVHVGDDADHDARTDLHNQAMLHKGEGYWFDIQEFSIGKVGVRG